MANEKVIVYDSGSVAMGSVTTFGIPAITLMSGRGTVVNAGGLLGGGALMITVMEYMAEFP